MKIIKKGLVLHNGLICSFCRCVFEYCECDIDNINNVSCPTCGCKINTISRLTALPSPKLVNICDGCATNKKNGGNGICCCQFGTPKITCGDSGSNCT